VTGPPSRHQHRLDARAGRRNEHELVATVRAGSRSPPALSTVARAAARRGVAGRSSSPRSTTPREDPPRQLSPRYRGASQRTSAALPSRRGIIQQIRRRHTCRLVHRDGGLTGRAPPPASEGARRASRLPGEGGGPEKSAREHHEPPPGTSIRSRIGHGSTQSSSVDSRPRLHKKNSGPLGPHRSGGGRESGHRPKTDLPRSLSSTPGESFLVT